MNKKVFDETQRVLIVDDIMLYIVISVFGFLLVNNNLITFSNYINDIQTLLLSVFYTIGFFSLLAYFMNRNRGDYEFLILSLINILIGSYIIVCKYQDASVFELGDIMLVYSLCCVANKSWHAQVMWKNKNINFLPKALNTFIIFILSLIMVYNLYSKEIVSDMIIGYYLLGFGLFSLFEPLFYVLFNNPTISKILISFLKLEDSEEEVKPKKVLKGREKTKKKIFVKKVEGSLVVKENNIKNNTKKRK